MEDAGQLQCVGKLEIKKPKPVGFLCGTLPVPTDLTFPSFHSAIALSPHTIGAPRYQMLPAETDLNALPPLSKFPEEVLPTVSKSSEGVQWDSVAVCQNLFKKCEALAVSGLTEYGDEIDVVAPTDILKQIFKIPYSKAQLSVAVQRIGDTLILNAGPKVEEEEKYFRRQSNQSKCSDPSVFLNFAMHSVRAEACDCPPAHQSSSQKQPISTSLPVNLGLVEDFHKLPTSSGARESHFLDQKSSGGKNPSEPKNDNYFWGDKMNKKKDIRPDSATAQIGEKPSCPIQDSEQCRRLHNSGFLRVLFWQFHNFRMLLGSDMLLFSNDKYAAVSLHLRDVTRQVMPLTWLEAWLDNIMASVPELAICYHKKGVVQGYELLKTDDIFLLKGVSEDGIPAFHPHVVQHNGLSVLRFLQENCKQDPGAYLLYKGSEEDVIQLFDLSLLPKKHPDTDGDVAPKSLLSLMHIGRRDIMFSLGTLLYRIAHRLSLSKAPSNLTKCAKFFKKCLSFLHGQDHMVVRAYAHEQFARLILRCNEKLELAIGTSVVEAEARLTNLEEDYTQHIFSVFNLTEKGTLISETDTAMEDRDTIANASIEAVVELNKEKLRSHSTQKVSINRDENHSSRIIAASQANDALDLCRTSTAPSISKGVVDPISSKLAAVHHVSQAIKSFRWKRHLQNAQGDLADPVNRVNEKQATVNFSLCECGDVNCFEICNIKEWLPKAKMNQKLWNLVLLLGESYLALGDAYKEDGQFERALRVVELACLVYGSMPQQLDDVLFISSMDCRELFELKERNDTQFSLQDSDDLHSNMLKEGYISEHLSPIYLFWPKAWSLIGDVYVEYQKLQGKEVQEKNDYKTSGNELRVSNEVVREVMRLQKKLGQVKKNCSSCLLINCSCHCDRANSGNSASSSGIVPPSHSKKSKRKSIVRASISPCENIRDTNNSLSLNYFNVSEKEYCEKKNEECKQEVPAKLSNEPSTVLGILDSVNTLDNSPSKLIFSMTSNMDEPKVEKGGIFRFFDGPKPDNIEYNLSRAICCYNAARNAMKAFPLDSSELTSAIKKKGWASNELGRYRLAKKDFTSAKIAFEDAILAFKEVSDYTNIILIYCNLGHGRRSLAEELVSKLEELIEYDIFQNGYMQTLNTAKLEYYESLKHYGTAKMKLNSAGKSCDASLYNEVHTQLAHTYLRLGMLLAREGISDQICMSTIEKLSVTLKDKEQHEKKFSASDAFREALSIYESLGELRKQESAFTHFQLANIHRSNCLKLVKNDLKQFQYAKGENKHLKTKWYASLADKHWKKAIEFYRPTTHSVMYLNILLEQAALSIDLSISVHSNTMLEAALLHLLDGRQIVDISKACEFDTDLQMKSKFWNQLQSLLKNMLSISGSCNKVGLASLSSPAAKVWDYRKLREMYRMSLKSNSFCQLHDMYELWFS